MFIELVDSLRCLEPHEETWLVASVGRMDGRHILNGTLGCPICRREYPIRDGVARFASEQTAGAARVTPAALTTVDAADEGTDDERLTRAAALLGLTDGGGIVALGGPWTAIADALPALGVAHVVVLNAPTGPESPQEVSALVVDDRLPFAPAALRGVALGGAMATASLLSSAASALRGRGRLLAPADAPVPSGITELARDAADWVGERAVVASPPVMLRSSRR
jgi:uncharacterized protein YbaR (Trm112 family)